MRVSVTILLALVGCLHSLTGCTQRYATEPKVLCSNGKDFAVLSYQSGLYGKSNWAFVKINSAGKFRSPVSKISKAYFADSLEAIKHLPKSWKLIRPGSTASSRNNMPILTASENLIPTYTPSLAKNQINLSQFLDIEPNKHLTFVFGQGSPYFKEFEETQPLLPLRKGWTHTHNASIYRTDAVPNARISKFFEATGEICQIASELTGKHPSLSHLQKNGNKTRLDLVTPQAAIDLGQTLFWYRQQYFDKDSQSFSKKINTWFMDEELWHFAPGYLDFMANVMKGMSIANPKEDRKIMLYGWTYAPTDFGMGNALPYPQGYKAEDFDIFSKKFRLHQPGFRESNIFLDFAMRYYRSPIPENASYYKKENGRYVLDNKGRRQLRDDEFSDSVFGSATSFITKPEDAVKRECRCVWQTAYKTEVYNAIYQQYQFHDFMQLGLAARYYAVTGRQDLSRYTSNGVRPAAVIRLETEHWMQPGLSTETKEIGDAGVKSLFVLAAMQGIQYIETWQDGTGGPIPPGWGKNGESFRSPLRASPKNGQQLYHKDYNYARFEAATAAVQGITKAFAGIRFDSTLRYFQFSKAITAAMQKEVLGGGFYQDNTLAVYFMYPFHDPEDETEITVYLGKRAIKRIRLKGRSPVIYRWKIDSGVSPDTLRISYKNIDGEPIFVTGNVFAR